MSNKQFVQLLLNKKRIINHWRISSILDGNENDYDGDEHVSFPAFLIQKTPDLLSCQVACNVISSTKLDLYKAELKPSG